MLIWLAGIQWFLSATSEAGTITRQGRTYRLRRALCRWLEPPFAQNSRFWTFWIPNWYLNNYFLIKLCCFYWTKNFFFLWMKGFSKKLIERCPNIEELQLFNSFNLPQHDYLSVLLRLKYLKRLSIYGPSNEPNAFYLPSVL